MGTPQDIFGSAPKSVLNKPYMQVQDSRPSGTVGTALAAGANDRVLNTVLINEIAGASLSSNSVILPAGTYYIEANAVASPASSSDGLKSYITDSDDNLLILGDSNRSGGAGDTENMMVAGQITLAVSTIIKLVTHCGGSGGFGGTATTFGSNEVYANLKIWCLDTALETPVVSDPTLTLKRPLLHVQDRKPSGTPGGASVIGGQYRTLNTITTNEISGSSLSSNDIILPAGTYFVDVKAPSWRTEQTYLTLVKDRAGTPVTIVKGQNAYTAAADSVGIVSHLQQQIVLTETTTLSVFHYTKTAAATSGLGSPMGVSGVDEIFTDLKIWQLDTVRLEPVLINNKLYPLAGDSFVTGNMYGLEYAKTGDNSVTVQAGSCMDSTNQVALSASSAQVVSIGTVINQIYNLFLCDDGVVRTDTDVNGTALSAYDFRWIGFVLNNSSGVITAFKMVGDVYTYTTPVTLGSATGGSTGYSVAPFVPVTRVVEAGVTMNALNVIQPQVFSPDGVLLAMHGGNTEHLFCVVVPDPNVYAGTAAGTSTLKLYSMRLKR